MCDNAELNLGRFWWGRLITTEVICSKGHGEHSSQARLSSLSCRPICSYSRLNSSFSTSELPLSDLHFVPPRLSPRRSDLLSRCRRRRGASRHFQQLLPRRPTRVTSSFTPTKEVKQMWRRRGRGFHSPPPPTHTREWREGSHRNQVSP